MEFNRNPWNIAKTVGLAILCQEIRKQKWSDENRWAAEVISKGENTEEDDESESTLVKSIARVGSQQPASDNGPNQTRDWKPNHTGIEGIEGPGSMPCEATVCRGITAGLALRKWYNWQSMGLNWLLHLDLLSVSWDRTYYKGLPAANNTQYIHRSPEHVTEPTTMGSTALCFEA